MCYLDKEDREANAYLQDFDATITTPAIQRHDVYTKALGAVREYETLSYFESLPHGPHRIKHGGCVIALDRERQPDRPGTVRKPGIRRLSGVNHTKRRWGGK